MGMRQAKLEYYNKPINLEKFSGSWYVIANLPTPFEKNAFNPVETYTFKDKSKQKIFDVDFRFNKGKSDGPLKKIPQILHTNSKDGLWEVQPFRWLSFFKLSYVIMDIGFIDGDENGNKYEYVVVGHPSRRYFWIMARETKLSPQILEQSLNMLQKNGFNTEKTNFPPQKANNI